MGFLSSLFGGGGAYNKSISDLEAAKSKELAYYDRIAHSDPLQNSENQAALRQARELLKDSTRRTAATAAVTGATDESVALQKAAANQSLENITSDIAANSTQYKDAAMQNYLTANRSYVDAINNVRIKKSESEAQALQGLLGGAKDLATGAMSAGLLG